MGRGEEGRGWSGWSGWGKGGSAIIHLQFPRRHMRPGSRRGEERRGEGERETRTESYLWHSDACLTLEEANHGIEVARMMGYRLSERGGEGGLL